MSDIEGMVDAALHPEEPEEYTPTMDRVRAVWAAATTGIDYSHEQRLVQFDRMVRQFASNLLTASMVDLNQQVAERDEQIASLQDTLTQYQSYQQRSVPRAWT